MNNFLLGKIGANGIIVLVLVAIMALVLIVLPMFTNKRRNKAINDLHSSLRPGDVIKTVGGIVGTIKEIKEISPVDKEMVVETGVGDTKCSMVFDIQAVYQVISKVDAPVASAEPVQEPFDEQPAEDKAEEQPVAPAEEESVPAEQAQEQQPQADETVAAAEPEAAPAPQAKKGAQRKTNGKK